ncbi:hypothetical protein AYI68_g5638 [Smittium mucronatum]|uniref:Uncharacterized protein n=1 Tax=Smittium mucronatum TaxID=133383 RepID=A0A1R0GTQ9_9FUNG|nr:hypothetical protein AYI68_g5638 [Smittium mucronatum]
MTTGKIPTKRKIPCLGGTKLKPGLPLLDNNESIEDFVENILSQFGETQTCFEIDNRRKIPFLKNYKRKRSGKRKKIEISYNGKKLDLLETTEYSEDVKNITMSSYSGFNFC